MLYGSIWQYIQYTVSGILTLNIHTQTHAWHRKQNTNLFAHPPYHTLLGVPTLQGNPQVESKPTVPTPNSRPSPLHGTPHQDVFLWTHWSVCSLIRTSGGCFVVPKNPVEPRQQNRANLGASKINILWPTLLLKIATDLEPPNQLLTVGPS